MDSTTINLSNYTMLIQYLMEHNITVSTAESCSGGLISKLITDIPGCSAIYPGGVCSYSNEMKMKWLNVKETTLKQYGAVSAETAQEMAQGIRMATGSIYGISTTGIAGPGGGSAEKPVGLVYIAIAGPDSCHVETLPLDSNIQLSRAEIQQQAAVYALSLLWKTIRESNLYKKEV